MVDKYAIIQRYLNGDQRGAVSDLIAADRSVHTAEVADSIIKRWVKDQQKAEQEPSGADDEWAVLEQSLAHYKAYDQLSLSFLHTYSKLGYSIEPKDRSDPAVQKEIFEAAGVIINALGFIVRSGVNPSSLLRSLIGGLQHALDPATGEPLTPPTGATVAFAETNFYDAVYDSMPAARKERYMQSVYETIKDSDLIRDLALITF